MRLRIWDQKEPGPYNKIYYFFLINSFVYVSNVILLPRYSCTNTPFHLLSFPYILPLWGCYPLTHLKHTTITFPYAGESSLHMKMGLPSHWCLVRWSSSTYVSGTMTLYIYTLSLMIFPLGALKDPANWYCCSYLIKSHSAPLLLPLAHPLGSTGQCVSACVFVKCL